MTASAAPSMQAQHRRMVVAHRVDDGGVDQVEPDTRDSSPCEIGDLVEPPRLATSASLAPVAARDREGDDGLAIEACEGARLLRTRRYQRRQLVQADLAVARSRRSRSGTEGIEAGRAPASVRIDCSWPPSSPRPPAMSAEVSRSWRFTSAAVMPSARSRSGLKCHTDLASDTAQTLDSADAFHALDLTGRSRRR